MLPWYFFQGLIVSLEVLDYTKDYPQEDVLRGLEETVQTVEATFHAGYVWTVWVDLVCD
jgi:hypothetical protein